MTARRPRKSKHLPPEVYRPEWVPRKVWRCWQRCCIRGYRQPTQSDLEEYARSFGSKKQQNKEYVVVSIQTEVTHSRVAATRFGLGDREFAAWKARIESGMSDPRFSVKGNSIVFSERRMGVTRELRGVDGTSSNPGGMA